ARVLAPDLLRGLLMMLMAMDHQALMLHTWEHGTGRVMEGDGVVVRRWNFTVAYIVRTLTHLCAPGFTFLLGMGVVYLGRSRTRLGWSAGRLARYFFLRCLVLTLVSWLFGLVGTGGQLWFMNMVLFALAVDYLIAGLLWLAIRRTEALLVGFLEGKMRAKHIYNDDDSTAELPLLRVRSTRDDITIRAEALAWHAHNAALFLLSIVTIAWNIWLSETGAHCASVSGHEVLPLGTEEQEDLTFWQIIGRIWFWTVTTTHVMSGFPPLAWVSFAILGVLYGRIMIARPWSPRTIALGHSLVGLALSIVFILTRVLRFGNLSEDCLHTPEQEAHPDANPYILSVRSFFYVVKYPPDVAFWAFTLAANFFLLAVLGAIPPHTAKRLTVLLDFGTSALFFYIVHLLVAVALSVLFIALFGTDAEARDPLDPDTPVKGILNLWGYFGIWALNMVIMWPLCRAYSRFKATKPADSLWRFF
ncbi:hypothetical protein B0I35DRAFT_334167, partial [Stachybotrys elegans]